jgi:phasin family protein
MDPHAPLKAFHEAGLANADTVRALAASAITTTERLVALNLDFARAALTRSAGLWLATPERPDWQETMAQQGSEMRQIAESGTAYLRGVYEIAAAAQGEVAEVVSSRFAESSDGLGDALDILVRNAPSGSKTAAGAMRSALASNRLAYENIVSTARQVAEANVAAVSNAVKAMSASPAATRKAA